MRVLKASFGVPSPKSCIWPKLDPVPPGGCVSQLRWDFQPERLARPGSQPTGCCPPEMPQLSRYPTLAAGLGERVSGLVPPAALCFLGSHRPHYPQHLSPRVPRPCTPSLPPAESKFLVLWRQEAALGAAASGPQDPGDFGVWLSRLKVFEVGPQSRLLGCQCTFYYLLDPCPPSTGKKPQVCVMGPHLRFKGLVSSSQNTLNLSLRGF